jgi:hypothetical protein
MDAGENPNSQVWILKKNGCDLAIMTVFLERCHPPERDL